MNLVLDISEFEQPAFMRELMGDVFPYSPADSHGTPVHLSDLVSFAPAFYRETEAFVRVCREAGWTKEEARRQFMDAVVEGSVAAEGYPMHHESLVSSRQRMIDWALARPSSFEELRLPPSFRDFDLPPLFLALGLPSSSLDVGLPPLGDDPEQTSD